MVSEEGGQYRGDLFQTENTRRPEEGMLITIERVRAI